MVRMSRCGRKGSPRYLKNVKKYVQTWVDIWNKDNPSLFEKERVGLSALSHMINKEW